MGAIRTTAAAVLMLIGSAASAADCVTAVRLISTRASIPNLVAGPAAWSGSVLAVAKSEEAHPNAIWVGIYSDGLDTLIADRRITTEASDSTSIIALLWSGEEFGLFYRTDERIVLQRLTSLGEPIGEPVAVNPNRRPRLGDDIKIVWSDALDGYVVARHIGSGTSRGIWVTILEEDGTQRYDREIPAAPPADPQLALAVSDTGVIGLFHLTTDDDTALLFTRLIPGQFPETHSVATAGTHVQVTTSGDLFVVARLVGEGPTAAIRWFIIDSNDHIVRPDGVLVANNGGELIPLALTEQDGELALTYAIPAPGAVVSDMHLFRFTLAGALISNTAFAGGDLTASRAMSTYAPVWTGMSYITAAVRDSGARLDSYLVRYCPLRAEIEAPRVVLIDQPVTFTANVGGGVPDYKYEWSVTRDPGGSNSGTSIQRSFNRTGTRTVTLTVTDKNGAQVTTTFAVEVVEQIEVPKIPKRRAVRK